MLSLILALDVTHFASVVRQRPIFPLIPRLSRQPPTAAASTAPQQLPLLSLPPQSTAATTAARRPTTAARAARSVPQVHSRSSLDLGSSIAQPLSSPVFCCCTARH